VKQPYGNVLVTRPAHQASTLIDKLKGKGFQPIKCPTIVIDKATNPQPALTKLLKIADYSLLIFTSANAVLHANLLLQGQWPTSKAKILAIGPKTQQALTDINIHHSQCAKPPFNSERLLDQITNTGDAKPCLIIKGLGGRKHLAESLQGFGFSVENADVYQRSLPKKPAQTLPLELPYITITSRLALDNLFYLYPEQSSLLKENSHFITLSERIAKHATAIGCEKVSFAKQATDNGLISALLSL